MGGEREQVKGDNTKENKEKKHKYKGTLELSPCGGHGLLWVGIDHRHAALGCVWPLREKIRKCLLESAGVGWRVVAHVKAHDLTRCPFK